LQNVIPTLNEDINVSFDCVPTNKALKCFKTHIRAPWSLLRQQKGQHLISIAAIKSNPHGESEKEYTINMSLKT